MIVYDTGALVAAERGDRGVWALHDAALRDRLSPLVPAGALAQAWRGGPQHNLSRLLKGGAITPLDEPFARASGALCGAAGTGEIVDASVLLLAHHAGAAIVSGDAAALRHLNDTLGGQVTIHAI